MCWRRSWLEAARWGSAGIRGRLLALAGVLGGSSACVRRSCVAGVAGAVAAASASCSFCCWSSLSVSLAAVELSGAAAACQSTYLLALFSRFLGRRVTRCSGCIGACCSVSVEAAFLLFLLDFFVAGVCRLSRYRSWQRRHRSMRLSCSFSTFGRRRCAKYRSRRPDRRRARICSCLCFFLFLLGGCGRGLIVRRFAAWGIASALIPDMTNNMQSTIIHVLSLFCSLFMISSSRRTGRGFSGSAPQGVWGTSRPVCGATIMTLRRIGVNLGNPGASWDLAKSLAGLTGLHSISPYETVPCYVLPTLARRCKSTSLHTM